jgi:uncharacterized membrane protein YhdT
VTDEVIGSQEDFPLQANLISINVSYELQAVGAPIIIIEISIIIIKYIFKKLKSFSLIFYNK